MFITGLLPVPDVPLTYLIIAVVILAAATAFLIRKRRTGTLPSPGTARQGGQKAQNLDYHPGIKPVPPVTQKSIPRPVQRPGVLPRPDPVSVTDGMADITASFRALTEKYSLDQFTLATADGLVFASSGGESALDDAARFGELFARGRQDTVPGVTLFTLGHKGSDLIGIIRTNLQVPGEIVSMIENDTKDILNRWI